VGGTCVFYWMQRAQWAVDNPALNGAIRVANELGKPVREYFAQVRPLRLYRQMGARLRPVSPSQAPAQSGDTVCRAFRETIYDREIACLRIRGDRLSAPL
jgi:hypothetical protein